MHKVYVAIASNFNAEFYIQRAIQLLSDAFGQLDISNIYRNPSIVEAEAEYFNLVVSFEINPAQLTSLERASSDLILLLKELESQLDRKPKSEASGLVSIDLDLILFEGLQATIQGRQLPSPDILIYSFILRPLSEIAADLIENASQKSYSVLWQAFDKQAHRLEKVD